MSRSISQADTSLQRVYPSIHRRHQEHNAISGSAAVKTESLRIPIKPFGPTHRGGVALKKIRVYQRDKHGCICPVHYRRHAYPRFVYRLHRIPIPQVHLLEAADVVFFIG